METIPVERIPMYYLSSIDRCGHYELESELKQFFSRIHYIKQQLVQQHRFGLNRIQRYRCRQNILELERLENDFDAISYREDIHHLYRKVHRYVKLDYRRLIVLFGRETLGRHSLFTSL